MKKFIVDLFSNRLGIALAALNLCCFAAVGFSFFGFMRNSPGKYFLALHLPALAAAAVSFEIVRPFAPDLAYAAQMNVKGGFFAVFLVAQWLLIAWVAKTLAGKLRRRNLD
jgi:hypothetical protein